MAESSIFTSFPIFQDIIIPFILVFVLVFAILQKTKLLGDGKKQIDAIIAFVVAAILITFSNAVHIITQLTVFMIIALFILFVFMLIYGFAYGDIKGDPLSKGLKTFLGIIAFIAVVVAVLVVTGTWDNLLDFFTNGTMGANILFVVLIIAAIAAVLYGSGKKSGGESKT